MTEKDFFKQMDGKRLFMTDLYLTYSTAYLESFHPLLRDQQYQPCQVALQNFRALAFFLLPLYILQLSLYIHFDCRCVYYFNILYTLKQLSNFTKQTVKVMPDSVTPNLGEVTSF